MVDEVKGFIESTIVSSAVTSAEEDSKKASKKLALAKLEKGYLVTNKGNMIRKPNSVRKYTEYIGEDLVTYYRASHTGTFRQGETTRGISQLPVMQKHMKGASMLYFIKNSAEIFGNFSSLVDLAQGGKDVNAVAADALALAATRTPFIGLLLSTFGKLTLDVLASLMKEFMEEGLERDKKELDVMKFEGIEFLTQELPMYPFLSRIYKTKEISFQTMQKLLEGTIKKQEDLKSAYGEVIILYKQIEDGILIDTFFININKKKYENSNIFAKSIGDKL